MTDTKITKTITNTIIITKGNQKFYHQGKMIDILPNLLSHYNCKKSYNKNNELVVSLKDIVKTKKRIITYYNFYVFKNIKKNLNNN